MCTEPMHLHNVLVFDAILFRLDIEVPGYASELVKRRELMSLPLIDGRMISHLVGFDTGYVDGAILPGTSSRRIFGNESKA